MQPEHSQDSEDQPMQAAKDSQGSEDQSMGSEDQPKQLGTARKRAEMEPEERLDESQRCALLRCRTLQMDPMTPERDCDQPAGKKGLGDPEQAQPAHGGQLQPGSLGGEPLGSQSSDKGDKGGGEPGEPASSQ
eukprot:10034686-Alexandrium_andersonii.AAC.1